MKVLQVQALALAFAGLLLPAAPPTDGALRIVEARRKLANRAGRSPLTLLDTKLDRTEREALTELLAALPLSDLETDAGPRLLADVRASLRARSSTPWGPNVPEPLFRSYVLPPRVFNEALDDFRSAHHTALLERVKGKTMTEAVLEVNLWCLSQATFGGTDPRTASPQTTIRTAFGRCTELSVLLVAALRSVAIPARLVLLPRWAHNDAYHAWAEAWVDGQWHFLGAAEPRQRLDSAWFDEHAPRMPRVETLVLGPGTQTVAPGTLEARGILDLTDRYAPVRRVHVKVVDVSGHPVSGARVDLRLANDGGLPPLTSSRTDGNGSTALQLGPVDAWIWARRGDAHGHQLLRQGGPTDLTILLDPKGLPSPLELDFAEPPPSQENPEPPRSQAHKARVKAADEVRKRAPLGGLDAAGSDALAKAEGYGTDIAPALQRARGNAPQILAFLRKAVPHRTEAAALLAVLTDKDRRDVSAETLMDHLPEGGGNALDPDVLQPRVDEEPLREGRCWLRARVPEELARTARQNPEPLAAWMDAQVRVETSLPSDGLPMAPRTVLELGVADARSRDIAFVALCRALGLPARLDLLTRQPLVRPDRTWLGVTFGPARIEVRSMGGVMLKASDPDVRFARDLSIARIEPEDLRPLAFPYLLPLDQIKGPIAFPVGDYLLTTNHRIETGACLTRMVRFTVSAGTVVEVPVVLRAKAQAPPEIRSR